jgi:SAM-dependent methyltransferase
MLDQIKPTTAATKGQLPDSLRFIVEKLEKEKELKPSSMRRILLEAGVKPEELEPWAEFDHPVEDSYGRKLAYKGDNFEIMVMSWRPGDFSAIHDHGQAQWGAVQVFGPAEHAAFRIDDDRISTLGRWQLKAGDAIGVHHDLVHQMGNPTPDTFFLTLHIYGEAAPIDNVTADARVFDLESGLIQRVDGGVFYALPANQIKRVEDGPKADFPTRLRHMIELIRRLRKMEARGVNRSGKNVDEVIADFMSARHHKKLLHCLNENTDENGRQTNSVYWRVLNEELKQAARLQNELLHEQKAEDRFHKYAELYDALICRPCLDEFMAGYLDMFSHRYDIDLAEQTVISLGCGTGLVEQYIIDQLGVDYNNLFGLDISEAMIAEAVQRIQAGVGDVLTLDPSVRMWDVAFSGLNVFQYIDHKRLEEAIRKTAAIIKPGGYFLGDFISPDHIRWYPNVVYSEDKKIISLRTPQLVESHGSVFQESEIVNISFMDEHMRVTYAGRHRRFLPPLHRVRSYFEKYFQGQVDLYDAVSLEPIPEWADSCKSTRYVVVARKE